MTRTINRIAERYYWPRMVYHVMSYVRACNLFQTRKSPPKEPQGLIEVIQVEVLGPFPLNTGGNVNIIVAVYDCGKCFIADFTKEIMRLMEVNHRTTTPYHPQANRLVERLNHTLVDMLSMFINSTQTNWDEILSYVTFAYNSSRQKSTGKTHSISRMEERDY